jgi:predicted dehydrogenase
LGQAMLFPAACLLMLQASGASATHSAAKQTEGKTRIAIVGLDHDHVWELLKYLQSEADAELVAIAESQSALVKEAKAQVRDTVKFYSAYVPMLDEAKPDAVIVTTSNDRHLEILRECAKRHIHYSVEKPMATNAADAREMERLGKQAGIKLMVNYWNVWVPPSHELFHRVKAGELGAVQKIIVQYGHSGPREIGVSRYFADWLYDPAKNGGGAIMDFGCYGAEWALWLKGRPARVFATAKKLKLAQHNDVDDDSTIVLDYSDATVIIEASWDWPYGRDRVQVFGPKGSLLATGQELLYRPTGNGGGKMALEGERISIDSLPRETSNPVSYFVDCIRHGKAIEDPLSATLNVQVMEVLDAARQSVITGRQEELR